MFSVHLETDVAVTGTRNLLSVHVRLKEDEKSINKREAKLIQ